MDLSKNFALPIDDYRCKPENIIYGPDFFETITATFQPKIGQWTNYDEVEKKLGKYKFRQEAITYVDPPGNNFFVCWYDLSGDRFYPIEIHFYEDGSLKKCMHLLINQHTIDPKIFQHGFRCKWRKQSSTLPQK